MQLSIPSAARSLVIPFPLRQSLAHTAIRPFVPSVPDGTSESVMFNAARVLGVTVRNWWPAN